MYSVMETLMEYLLTVILRNADEVESYGICCGEDAFTVSSFGYFVLTKSDIKQMRSVLAKHWRYLCDSERHMIYANLKKMK